MESVFQTVDRTKGIQERTRIEYKKRLRRVLNWLEAKGDTWKEFEEFSKVNDTIRGKAISTRQAYLSTIAVVLRETGDAARQPYLTYREALKENNTIIEDEYDNQKPVEGEVTWDEIIRARGYCKERASFDRLTNTKHLILCLYTMQPPVRNNYGKMAITLYEDCDEHTSWERGDSMGYKVVETEKESTRDTENLCVIRDDGSIYFVFRNHKTRRDKKTGKYNEVYVECCEELADVIRESIDLFPRKWLLEKFQSKGDPCCATSMSSLLKTEFPNKRAPGACAFRRAYLTEELKGMPAYKSRARKAAMMMHSVETGERKYRKII